MPTYSENLSIVVDGVEAFAHEEPLARAVIISLFTWRRAAPEDLIEGEKWGWWGDNVSFVQNDQIGSRLWLLARQKLTQTIINQAIEYANEALDWMKEDGVVSRITVEAERNGLDGLAMRIVLYRHDGTQVVLRFSNLWDMLNV